MVDCTLLHPKCGQPAPHVLTALQCPHLHPCPCPCPALPCSPAGTFSAEGDAACTPCPLGEYSPSAGLADQSSITGFNCVKCAVGSMPLSSSTVDPATGGAGLGATPTVGATFCDAWWVGDEGGFSEREMLCCMGTRVMPGQPGSLVFM